MPRPTRRAGLLMTAATAAVTAASVLLPAPATAAPATPSFGRVIEGFAAYDGQKVCDPTTKPGTAAVRSLLMNAYRSTGDLGIVRACAIGGTSEHKEGRAWDWAINVSNATQEASAQNFFTWALATDKYGNSAAMARRLGIMYMIHNRKIWSAYNASAGWRPYTGPNPHLDHVHFSFSWAGARKTTTYWNPAKSGTATSPVTSPAPTAPTPVPTKPPVTSVNPITAKWTALGGTAGLGAAVSAEYAVPGGRARNYARGRILWSTATGAHAVTGTVLTKYLAAGGPAALGLPTTDRVAVPGGWGNTFTRARILYSSATGTHVVLGKVLERYNAVGGPGVLGLPTTDEIAVPGGRGNVFTKGRILWSGSTGAHAVQGHILTKYLAAGGPAVLGLPTTDEVAAAGGRASTFTRGTVLYSGTTGAHVVVGSIRAKYVSIGGAAVLGLPTTDEFAVTGGRASAFTKGRILWSGATAAHVVAGTSLVKYNALGGPAAIGLPTADEVGVPGGRSLSFQRGRILYSNATGAHLVAGPILRKYDELGGAAALGLPTTDEVAAPGGRRSSFSQGDRILYSTATGAHRVGPAIGAKYDSLGGYSSLGLPTADQTAAGSGQGVTFQRGHLYWSGRTGAHVVRGAILSRYLSLSGPTGRLGLPTSDQRTWRIGERSDFEDGQILYDATSGQTLVRAYWD